MHAIEPIEEGDSDNERDLPDQPEQQAKAPPTTQHQIETISETEEEETPAKQSTKDCIKAQMACLWNQRDWTHERRPQK
jgi:hypothetical protein